MAPEEDDTLLFLIYQHLKVNGYEKAAKVLEKHVTQVRSLALKSSPFAGWMSVEPTWLVATSLIFASIDNINFFFAISRADMRVLCVI